MKKKLHPAYYQTKVVCACGNTFTVGSTLSETIKVEVCSHCHPFYTGKQKLIDSTGRVDKFKRRTQIAKDIQNKEKQAPLVLPDSIPEMAPVSIKKRASTATEAPGKGKNTVTHKKIANKLVIKKPVKKALSTVAKKSSHPVSKGKTSVGKKVLSKKIAVKKKMKK